MARPVTIIGFLLLVLAAVVLWRLFQGPTIDRELSESWVIEYRGAGSPDTRASQYLSRRTSSGLREVSGKLFDAAYIGDDILYREDGYGGDYSFGGPVLAYRSLGDDCLAYAYPGVPGQYGVFATCGRRYEVHVGSVESPADIQAVDEIRITGKPTLLSEIKRLALSERER